MVFLNKQTFDRVSHHIMYSSSFKLLKQESTWTAELLTPLNTTLLTSSEAPYQPRILYYFTFYIAQPNSYGTPG